LFYHHDSGDDDEIGDMAGLTLQCGRHSDSFKMAMAWTYDGAKGPSLAVHDAFVVATPTENLVVAHADFQLVSSNTPLCLQVFFDYAPGDKRSVSDETYSPRTKRLVGLSLTRGFTVDHAVGDRGFMLRNVVNWQTLQGTMNDMLLTL
jgi:glutamate decarboxylase